MSSKDSIHPCPMCAGEGRHNLLPPDEKFIRQVEIAGSGMYVDGVHSIRGGGGSYEEVQQMGLRKVNEIASAGYRLQNVLTKHNNYTLYIFVWPHCSAEEVKS